MSNLSFPLRCNLIHIINTYPDDLDKIEQCIIDIFDESLEFIPAWYSPILTIIVESIFISRTNKMKLINRLCKMGIPFDSTMCYHSTADIILDIIIRRDFEFLRCLTNNGFVFPKNLLESATHRYKRNFYVFSWLLDNVGKLYKSSLHYIFENIVAHQQEDLLIYLVKKIKLNPVEIANRRINVFNYVVNRNINWCYILLKAGFFPFHELNACILTCMETKRYGLMKNLVNAYLANREKCPPKRRDYPYILERIITQQDLEALMICKDIYDHEKMLTVLNRLGRAGWFQAIKIIIDQIKEIDNPGSIYKIFFKPSSPKHIAIWNILVKRFPTLREYTAERAEPGEDNEVLEQGVQIENSDEVESEVDGVESEVDDDEEI